MFREERLRLIMEMIMQKNVVIVKDLSKKFNCSDSSIRLDLAELEARGLIARTHGGAMSVEGASPETVFKSSITSRQDLYREEKERIGKATVELIHDGDSILIDGGSTTHYVAKNLYKKRGLTIITTSLHLLPLLVEIPDCKVFLTGGLYFREFEELIGEISMESITRFKPDHTILGIDGISTKHGLTSTEPTIAPIKRKMISISNEIIIVSDFSKFEKTCLLHVADFNEIHKIVTDSKVSRETVSAIEAQGPKVILT